MPYVNVDIDMSEFSDDELLEEISLRGLNETVSKENELLEKIYNLRRLKLDYQKELDELIFDTLGKII